jgi:hypothetical protein
MTSEIEVSNPTWLKAGLMGGLVLFGALEVYLVWAAARDGSRSLAERAALAACALFFAWVILGGLKLLRFLNHVLSMDDEMVTISGGSNRRCVPWSDLRVRVSQALQIIDVIDSNGKLIYSVDFFATNARHLRLRATKQTSNSPASD